jgi:AcrR family transcriptional regulator
MFMARILKHEEHMAKRNEILNAAQKLIYTKGYEQMTIQDILNELGISKGSFFHYFISKQAMLEALIERYMDEGEGQLAPVVKEDRLSAIEKLNKYFTIANKWKSGQKEYLIHLMRIWYSDDNAIVRQKMLSSSTKRIAPMLDSIISQGVFEGTFKPAYPDLAGEIMLSLIQNCWDRMTEILLANMQRSDSSLMMRETIAAYTDAIEKVLGVPTTILKLIDHETIDVWLNAD